MNKQSPIQDSIKKWLSKYYGIESTAKPLAGYADLNFKVKDQEGNTFVFKVASSELNREQLEFQTLLLGHLAQKKIDLQLPHTRRSSQGEAIVLEEWNGEERMLRLLSWVPGKLMVDQNPHSLALMEDLGEATGKVTAALKDFDHPAAHFEDQWDVVNVVWTQEYLHLLDEEQRELSNYFYTLYQQVVLPISNDLPQSVVHNDANDYNILLEGEGEKVKVSGLIDFGDAVYTHTINDLAIAAAYAAIDKQDPLEIIIALTKGYHRQNKLNDLELQALLPAIGARLIISMTKAAIARKEEPENPYLQVSARPGLHLLRQLRHLSPQLAYYHFRSACGMEACTKASIFNAWIATQKAFASLVPSELLQAAIHVFDLSVGSLELGNNPNFEEDDRFENYLDQIMRERKVELAIGKYNEIRPLYTTDEYIIEGNNGPEWRSLHLGLDFFAKAGTPIYLPLAGKVFSVHDNAGDRNYGPTLIVEHSMGEEGYFYTLYGHLGMEVLTTLHADDELTKGQQIATIGPRPINGNWPPHLHFQILLDCLDYVGDFPGVAFPQETEVWTSICPDPNLIARLTVNKLDAPIVDPENLKDQRSQLLAPNLSLSYQQPLTMVRAYKQYLYNHLGRRFLDLVNNVPHVGHQHPRVVRAAARQLAVLNTNTRYLHQNILDFSEKLSSKFPAPLEVCFFVNSGSEANELAYRMAKNWTKQKDLIVSEVGYHGNSNACVEMSSYKFDGPGGSGAADHIHPLPLPDSFRGPYRSNDEEAGLKYATPAQEIINRLAAEGRSPAAVITEPILSCGGQIVPPPSYLKSLYQQVRAAGGLCIADEVQTGFGRIGKHFWAFELQGVVPDIVTMGKPIGNGHPLGAVITSRAIADAFANGMEYFNTFGGNPVSCAIGLEVQRIIEEEDLQENAYQMGAQIKQGLKALQIQYPIIGDVRGEGLFLGMELVHEGLKPAAKEATYLVNRLRAHGILLSTDGPDHNVIKIKPPMCVNQQNVDFLLRTMDKILKEDYLTNRE